METVESTEKTGMGTQEAGGKPERRPRIFIHQRIYESRAHTRSKDSNLKRNTDKKRSCQYRRLLSKTTQSKATCFETKLNRVVPNGMLCGVRGRN